MGKSNLFMANTPIVHDSDSKWSRVLLNDTKELVKKQSQNATSGYSRRLFAKIKRTSTPGRPRSRPNFYHKYVTQSKRGTPVAAKKPKENIDRKWKQENDVWQMFQQAIQQSLQDKHQLNLPNKEFAVRNSCDSIRLITNREELNEQVLVSSNGMRSHVKDFVNPNECTENMVFKVRYRLVPVIEGITVVNNSMETTYQFADNSVDINNNNNDIESDTTLDSSSTNSDTTLDSSSSTGSMDEESEGHCDYKTVLSNNDFFQDTTEDRTMTNSTCSTWEYSDFQNDISPEAASTFISEEKEKISFLAAPKKCVKLSLFICWYQSSILHYLKHFSYFSFISAEVHRVR